MISHRHPIALTGILAWAGFSLVGPSAGIIAQPIVTEATLEARMVMDSSGCPEAIDLWLFATPDSIMGLEVVLTWDSPDIVRFVRVPDTAGSGEDTVGLRNPAPGYDTEIIKIGGLLATWSYIKARSRTNSSVKITAVADFLRSEGAQPIPAGASGLLCRLPLTIQRIPRGAPPIDSLTLRMIPDRTNLADGRGDLLDPPYLMPVTIDLVGCPLVYPDR
jgi:hypothetical protein